jgi:hypothetical protein
MAQQTAVEFFWNLLPFTVDTETGVKLLRAFEQAKEMEKEQHSDTWIDSRVFDKGDDYIGKTKSFDQYYNETYGK